MSDENIARVKRNIKRMLDGGATEAEVDQYLSGEGVSVSDLRPKEPMGGLEYIDNLVRQVAEGATFGLSDEIAAGGNAAVEKIGGLVGLTKDRPIGEIYDENLKAERAKDRAFEKAHPKAAMVAEIAGAIPTSLAPMGAVGRTAQVGSGLSKLGANLAIGAGQGALYGFNAGEGGVAKRAQNATEGAAWGAAGGALAPVAGKIGDKFANSKTFKALRKTAPTTEKLQATAGPLFDSADGVQIAPERMSQFVDDLTGKLKSEGLHPALHPKAVGVLGSLGGEAAEGASNAIMTTRRIIAGVAKSTDPDERRIGSMMLEAYDDLVENMVDSDLSAGAAEGVSRNLKEARKVYSSFRKNQIIDRMIEKAESTASGLENGLRIEARRLLNNEKKLRGFTPDEKSMLKEIADGTFSANLLRRLGQLSFGEGARHNVMHGLQGSAAGGFLGSFLGPTGAVIGAIVPPTAGYAGRKGAEKIALDKMRALKAVIATGGVLPPLSNGSRASLPFQRSGPWAGALITSDER